MQDGSQRAQPRGLSSSIEKTVQTLTKTAVQQPGAATKATTISRHYDSVHSDNLQVSADGEQEHTLEHESDASNDAQRVTHTQLGATDGTGGNDMPYEALGGKGRPPLSPVRQSLQDLMMSRESTPGKGALVPGSIDPVTGMPKQDINVHCNPLFTEPMAAQQSSVVHRHMADAASPGTSALAVAGQGVGQQKAVTVSPPSKLQQSLRTLLQDHADRMEASSLRKTHAVTAAVTRYINAFGRLIMHAFPFMQCDNTKLQC